MLTRASIVSAITVQLSSSAPRSGFCSRATSAIAPPATSANSAARLSVCPHVPAYSSRARI